MEWYPFFYKGHETNIEVNKLGEVRRVPKDWMKYNSNTGIVKFSVSNGYYQVSVSIKNFGLVKLKVHQIMAIVFLNHIPKGHEKVVDHISGNKLNNNLKNLQIITQRENTLKRKKKSNYPVGVYCTCAKRKNKIYYYFIAQVRYKDKQFYLGNYKTPEEASAVYQEALQKINAGKFAVN